MPRSNDDAPPGQPGRLTRLGLALARPRWALAIADDPAESGRAGTDLVVLLLAAFVAVHAREVVATLWLAIVIDPWIGVRTLVGVLARTVNLTLLWLLVGAALIWGVAGARRSLGRDFDLACVAVVPIVVVEVAAALVVRALGLEIPPVVDWTIAGAGFAWAGVLITLGVAQARGRGGKATAGMAAANLPAGARRAGLGAGAGTLGAAALVLALNAVWMTGHVDWLRPMEQGDRAPAFALPRIEADGTLGELVESTALTDKVVVLDFWATWCKPCRDAMPALSALSVRGKGHIAVLSINLDSPAHAWDLFVDGKYRHTLVADAGHAAERYGLSESSPVPHLVVVDRGGIVRMVSRGGDVPLQQVIDLAEELGGLHGHGK